MKLKYLKQQLIRAIKHRFTSYTEVYILYKPTYVYAAHIYDVNCFGKRYIDRTIVNDELDELYKQVLEKLIDKKNINIYVMFKQRSKDFITS